MAFVPEVKCPRCDRRYMALRARCPYCGTYRRRRTGKSAETDNAMWKTVVGSAIMLVLAVGVVVLIADANKNRTAQQQEATMQQQQQEQQDASLERTITSLAQEADEYAAQQAAIAAENGEDITQQEETPVVPDIPIESIKLFNSGNNKELTASKSADYNYDISLHIGDTYNLGFSVVPESRNGEVEAVWSSSDTGKLAVLQSGKITAMSAGVAYLYCEVENARASVIVRIS